MHHEEKKRVREREKSRDREYEKKREKREIVWIGSFTFYYIAAETVTSRCCIVFLASLPSLIFFFFS